MMIDSINDPKSFHHRTNFIRRAQIVCLFRHVIKTVRWRQYDSQLIYRRYANGVSFINKRGPLLKGKKSNKLALLNKAFVESAYRLLVEFHWYTNANAAIWLAELPVHYQPLVEFH